VRLEVFTAMIHAVMVLWVSTLCSDVVGYHHFKGTIHVTTHKTMTSIYTHNNY